MRFVAVQGHGAGVSMVDDLLAIGRSFDPSLELKFHKHYIGLSKSGAPYNFVFFQPHKSTITLFVKLPKIEETDEKINASSLDALEYDNYSRAYRLSLDKEDIATKHEVLKDLIGMAHQNRTK